MITINQKERPRQVHFNSLSNGAWQNVKDGEIYLMSDGFDDTALRLHDLSLWTSHAFNNEASWFIAVELEVNVK